jgi:hypothetical protein
MTSGRRAKARRRAAEQVGPQLPTPEQIESMIRATMHGVMHELGAPTRRQRRGSTQPRRRR